MTHGTGNMLCIMIVLVAVAGCSMLANVAKDAIMGSSSGGISAEVVVGDKEQVLGSNIEVKAERVDKVVGASDNSVVASAAEEVNITNNSFPAWAIFLIGGLTTLIGYLAPRPAAWKRFIGNK